MANVNEWGYDFVFGTGLDLSASTELQIEFTKPDKTVLTVASPNVTAPNADLQTTAGLFPAKTYAQYVVQNGDFDQVGEYLARVVYDDATPLHLISDVGSFIINP